MTHYEEMMNEHENYRLTGDALYRLQDILEDYSEHIEELMTLVAGHVYHRKNEDLVEYFGTSPNVAYRKNDDDILVQMNIVVPSWSPVYDELENVNREMQVNRLRAEEKDDK